MKKTILALIVAVSFVGAANAKQDPVQHARNVIKFFDHHRKAAGTPTGQRVLWRAIHQLDTALRSLQAVKSQQAIFPPHHSLWLCLHQVESPSWSYGAGTNDSHSGGLGMMTSWGHGIVGVAGNYTESEQEWAAERGYAASGYSYSFLYGNWYEWEYGKGDHCQAYA